MANCLLWGGGTRLLFNSHVFLFAFFPATLAIYWLLRERGTRAQQLSLLFGSLVFYAWWDYRFVALLLASIGINFLSGCAIVKLLGRGRERTATGLLGISISLDLASIGVFKYANFFVQNLNFALDTDWVLGKIILPLGISFFTFEQISFLVDVRRGHTRPDDLLRYALFVTFFPRLVAGPILRHSEISPQLARRQNSPISEHIAIGLSIFFVGLVKKSVLADGIAPHATNVFNQAAVGQPIDFFMSWGGAVAYTCQLYFDFSGYSDMAIGAARCFGIRFPMNFFSPYKSTSIIEFWQRWHITLSRFLRDYLYISLGGSRRGRVRRYWNLIVTMLLGGLWHGASWTFILWGGLHGVYIMINHMWIALSGQSAPIAAFRQSRAGKVVGWTLTFTAVVVSLVFFRAPSFGAAITMLSGMAGLHGFDVPAGLVFAIRPLIGSPARLGFHVVYASGSALIMTYLWVASLLLIALFLPSTQEIFADHEPVLESAVGGILRKRLLGGVSPARSRLAWRPSATWAIAMGTLAFFGTISITRVSEFLYWQF